MEAQPITLMRAVVGARRVTVLSLTGEAALVRYATGETASVSRSELRSVETFYLSGSNHS